MLTASVTRQLDGKPDMVIGMHFLNPPSRMTLLEIVHNEVNFIEEPDTLVAKVDEIASKLANGAPLAQKLAKALFYFSAQGDQRTGSFIESSVSASISLTKDLNDGLTSMSYRRNPEFKGR